MRRGPRIATTERTIAITAISHEQGNLYCWTSTDRGATWTQAVRVNDVTNAAREGLHAMAAQSNTVAAAWLDLRTGKTELRGSISSDGGITWSKNFLIYRSPDGHICECCHPSLAFAPDGKLFAMWRNSLNGSRDMYLSVSDDGAKTFSVAQKLGTGTWPLNACPMDGGALAINQDGVPVTAWRRGKNIVTASDAKSETPLIDDGSQPCIAISKHSTNIVWQSNGRIVFPGSFTANGKYPAIASRDLETIAVWETGVTASPISARLLP
jgi:hypothetical protein